MNGYQQAQIWPNMRVDRLWCALIFKNHEQNYTEWKKIQLRLLLLAPKKFLVVHFNI